MVLNVVLQGTQAGAARLAPYRGAEAVASFTSPAAELDALLHSAGLSHLTWRGKLVVSGEDRTRWLNGMVSNNTRDLQLNHGNYSFLLNAQGRIQADLNAYNRGEIFMVCSTLDQLPRIAAVFEKHIIMDDVELTDISAKLASLAVTGPKSREMLARAGFDFPALAPGAVHDLQWNGLGMTLAREPDERFESYELWLHPDNLARVWEALTTAGAVPAGTDALEAHRILLGIPQIGRDIRERELPQETGQLQAIHHNKGCYIGQEIVERIHSRGAVHRILASLEFASALPESGARVIAGGNEAGEITSAVQIEVNGRRRLLGLGYLRREAAALGAILQAGGVETTVAQLPFKM